MEIKKIIKRVGFVSLVTALTAGFVFGFYEFKIGVPNRNFQRAKRLEGVVVDTKFQQAKTFNASDAYTIIVQMPDGSKKYFEYSDRAAREANLSIKKEDIVQFKDGYRPGTTNPVKSDAHGLY